MKEVRDNFTICGISILVFSDLIHNVVSGCRDHFMDFLFFFCPAQFHIRYNDCLLYTSDAADDLLCVDLGGRRIFNKKKVLDVVERYTAALDLLDDYDHQTIKK